ncbi:MAG TPA: hypothetical protein VHL09_16595 [Dehalococcoidia bacterium]|nr:hypothetical protein [Dehalococcoidia bacterium]
MLYWTVISHRPHPCRLHDCQLTTVDGPGQRTFQHTYQGSLDVLRLSLTDYTEGGDDLLQAWVERLHEADKEPPPRGYGSI